MLQSLIDRCYPPILNFCYGITEHRLTKLNMPLTARLFCCLLAALCVMSLFSCATGPATPVVFKQAAENDPLEKTNRAIYGFNQTVDKAVFRPVSEIYRRRFPQPLKLSVGNFFNNLGEPTTILNDILQGNGRQAINDGARFVINTGLGLFGLLDLATPLGLPYHREDYGQTLAVWGIPSGPYLVLPILGPSNARDAVGKLPALFLTDPLLLITDEPYLGAGRYGLLHAGFRTLHAIDLRAQLLVLDPLIELQLDPYLFLRESYRQNRFNAITDNRNEPLQVPSSIEEILFSD